MAQFQYRAKQGPERILEGVIEASSESSAIEKITQMGYMPIRVAAGAVGPVSEIRKPFLSLPRLQSHPKKNVIVGSFSRYLANLSKAGLPLFRSIEILADLETNPAFKEVLSSLKRDISRGMRLSQAMSAHPEFFSTMYVSMIDAGESGGDLRQGLTRMALYLQKQEELASKVRRAMVYPSLLMAAGVGSVFFILTFAVPRFSLVFRDLGKDLPLSTRMIMGVGDFFSNTWFYILFAAFFLILILPKVLPNLFKSEHYQKLGTSIPVIRRVLIQTAFSRFIRALELCLTNGMVFVEALKVSIPVVNHRAMQESLVRAYRSVENGGSFGRALKSEPYFSGISAEMISVGEESGSLPEVLREMADTHDREIDEAISYMMTLLEPVMILLVGAVVAFIVISLLLPVFELNTLI